MVKKMNGKMIAAIGAVAFVVLVMNSGSDSHMETHKVETKVIPKVETTITASYVGSSQELKKYVAKALDIDEDSIGVTESYSSSHSIEGYVSVPNEKKQLYVAFEWDSDGPVGLVVGSECYFIKDGELSYKEE